MGGAHYFELRQGCGWIFPLYVITTYNRILHTNTPAQYKLNSDLVELRN